MMRRSRVRLLCSSTLALLLGSAVLPVSGCGEEEKKIVVGSPEALTKKQQIIEATRKEKAEILRQKAEEKAAGKKK